MDFSELFGFIGIVSESFKIISKSRKTLAIIAAVFILIRSSIYIIVTFSTKQVIKNLLGEEIVNLFISVGTPGFPDLLTKTKKDVIFVLAIEWVFILISLCVTIFAVGFTILVSATTYCEQSSAYKYLVPKLANSFMKQLATSFHITIYFIGYIFLLIGALIPPILLIFDIDHIVEFNTFIYIIIGVWMILVVYLSIVWILAMVITVIEGNCYGMEALGKAATLIKGKKMQAFALNFVLMLGALIMQVLTTNRKETSVSKQVVTGICMICFDFIVLVLQYVSYTVLYFQCKKSHGEEIELQGDWGYSKAPLVTEDFP